MIARITKRRVRKIAVLCTGGPLCFVGVALLVLPGPGIVVIALGVAVLSTEFPRARLWLRRGKRVAKDLDREVRGRFGRPKKDRGKGMDA